jgi:hypothetical protein
LFFQASHPSQASGARHIAQTSGFTHFAFSIDAVVFEGG